jgi:GTP-sensing pleiotropic transcriptional regulator CodY
VKGSWRGQFLVLTTPCLFGTLRVMARKLRVKYAGAIYHVMNRGDRREGTLVTVKWIAERLGMIRAGYVLRTFLAS